MENLTKEQIKIIKEMVNQTIEPPTLNTTKRLGTYSLKHRFENRNGIGYVSSQDMIHIMKSKGYDVELNGPNGIVKAKWKKPPYIEGCIEVEDNENSHGMIRFLYEGECSTNFDEISSNLKNRKTDNITYNCKIFLKSEVGYVPHFKFKIYATVYEDFSIRNLKINEWIFKSKFKKWYFKVEKALHTCLRPGYSFNYLEPLKVIHKCSSIDWFDDEEIILDYN
jgi:hypothetical protein